MAGDQFPKFLSEPEAQFALPLLLGVGAAASPAGARGVRGVLTTADVLNTIAQRQARTKQAQTRTKQAGVAPALAKETREALKKAGEVLAKNPNLPPQLRQLPPLALGMALQGQGLGQFTPTTKFAPPGTIPFKQAPLGGPLTQAGPATPARIPPEQNFARAIVGLDRKAADPRLSPEERQEAGQTSAIMKTQANLKTKAAIGRELIAQIRSLDQEIKDPFLDAEDKASLVYTRSKFRAQLIANRFSPKQMSQFQAIRAQVRADIQAGETAENIRAGFAALDPEVRQAMEELLPSLFVDFSPAAQQGGGLGSIFFPRN